MRFRCPVQGVSLKVALLVFLVLPLVAVLTVVGYVSLQRLEMEVEKRMQEDIELIARAIRGPLEYSLEQGRQGSLGQALASAFRFERVYGVYVYDRNGQQIAASGPREPAVRSRELAELAAGGNRTGLYQGTEGEHVYSYFVPLTDSVGRNTGLLQVTRQGSDFRDYIQRVRTQGLILLALLSFLLVGAVIYGHHRIIGRNLASLVGSMARIEKGERTHRASFSGPREIRQLAAGMNAMLNSIERSKDELEKRRQQQVLLEQQLQQSQKMAAIGQLAAGVAHELGTPLSIVSGKAQRMLRKPELPDSAAAVFREIRDAVQRMEQIVRQLLDFGRVNRLCRRSMRLDELAECAALQVREEARKKRIALELAGARPATMVTVDPVRLEQALVNLLRNAVQAVETGGRVRLEWFEAGNGPGFTVADTGPGIPEELYSRLFEPFFTTKAVGEGTGLGLAVAQAAASDHGGELGVGRSELGGALFTMIFKNTEWRDEKSDEDKR